MRLVVGVTKNEHLGYAVFQAPVVCHQSLQPCGEAANECDKSRTSNVHEVHCTRLLWSISICEYLPYSARPVISKFVAELPCPILVPDNFQAASEMSSPYASSIDALSFLMGCNRPWSSYRVKSASKSSMPLPMVIMGINLSLPLPMGTSSS